MTMQVSEEFINNIAKQIVSESIMTTIGGGDRFVEQIVREILSTKVDAECKVVGKYKDRNGEGDVTFVITASGSKHDCPILLNIWHTDEKVTSMERYDYSEENLKNIVKYWEGKIDRVPLTEGEALEKSVSEILSVADAICVS